MQGHKRILQSEAVRRALCWLGAQYIRLAHATGRWTVVRGDIPRAFWDRGEPFVLCFWHGRLLMIPFVWDYRFRIRVLTSQHRDGRTIARTVSHFGIPNITGSTQRGGAGALRAMVRVLQGGESVGLTPDGPRGPRMRASDGVVAVARLAGVAVIPVTFGVDRRKVLNTWDRFVVAWPFARGVLVWGEPIRIARDADAAAREAARLRVEAALNAITAEADALVGAAPIEPAPVPAEGGAP